MYDINISVKVNRITKELAERLADADNITVSHFARLAIEDRIRSMAKKILVERGFDENIALSLVECMRDDDSTGIGADDVVLDYRAVDTTDISVDDVMLAYRAVDGHIVEASREEVEDALAGVVIARDRKSGEVVTTQNGKVVDDNNPVLFVVKWDKELGVMVIA